MSENLKRTPLYEWHKSVGAKLVSFAGWEMPIQYSGIVSEHNAVRMNMGLFDVSHMGEIFVSGPEAEKALDYLTCNDVRSLVDGKAQYSAITNEKGGLIDDIIIYRFSSTRYLLCVNASNSDKDFQWLKSHNKFNCSIEDRSSEYGQMAVQGPLAVGLVEKATGRALAKEVKSFHFVSLKLFGVDVIAARTGYTGEDGFEIFTPWNRALEVWEGLFGVGEDSLLEPAGLGARDSLRLEACLPLYGHELADDWTAIESGLGWIVKPDKKGDFLGRAVLERQKKEGSPRSLVGFFVNDSGIVRQGDKIVVAGKEVGVVTSGTKTPYLNQALGLALIESKYKEVGSEINAVVRGKELKCEVVTTPFYRRT